MNFIEIIVSIYEMYDFFSIFYYIAFSLFHGYTLIGFLASIYIDKLIQFGEVSLEWCVV